MPAAAKGKGRPAAKAFVRYYIDLINYAGRTGEVDELASLSADACESCSQLTSLFEKTYSRGGFFDTKGWQPAALFVIPGTERGVWTATTEVTEHRVRWQTSSTAPQTSAPTEKLNLRLELTRTSGRWEVAEMTRS
jgi:hypothetical protein